MTSPSVIEVDDTDLFADMIDSLFADTDLIFVEELNTDYVRNSLALFAGDSTLAQKISQAFLNGKELNPDEEFAFGAAVQAAICGHGFHQMQKQSTSCLWLTAWTPCSWRSRNSKVELNAHDDVLAEDHCAKRGIGLQSERNQACSVIFRECGWHGCAWCRRAEDDPRVSQWKGT